VQIAGLSGQLHFDAQGRVQRDLIWVQVRDGEPKRLTVSAGDHPNAGAFRRINARSNGGGCGAPRRAHWPL
jgi:hypothetical protein